MTLRFILFIFFICIIVNFFMIWRSYKKKLWWIFLTLFLNWDYILSVTFIPFFVDQYWIIFPVQKFNHSGKVKIPISLKDAKARGYIPCSRCNPNKWYKSINNQLNEKLGRLMKWNRASMVSLQMKYLFSWFNCYWRSWVLG